MFLLEPNERNYWLSPTPLIVPFGNRMYQDLTDHKKSSRIYNMFKNRPRTDMQHAPFCCQRTDAPLTKEFV